VSKLTKDIGLRQTLSELGLTEKDLGEIAGDVIKYSAPAIKMNSPRDARQEDVLQILKAAF
jgi:alcohol dehydrogenase class IV